MTSPHRTMTRHLFGASALLLTGLALPGCASSPATMTTLRNETVPVVYAIPWSDPQAQETCPLAAAEPTDPVTDLNGFCVVYEYQGNVFTVRLPTAPGPSLVIQVPEEVPVVPDQAVGVAAPVYTYPSAYPPPYPVTAVGYPIVFWGGAYYRPRLYHTHQFRPHVQPPRPPVPVVRPLRPPPAPVRIH
ncbi:MAG: hypothetical protein RLZZ123_2134 [Pseudomonadota bacterium]